MTLVIVGGGPAGLAAARAYRAAGRAGAGVFSHNRDEDYERAQELVAAGAPAC